MSKDNYDMSFNRMKDAQALVDKGITMTEPNFDISFKRNAQKKVDRGITMSASLAEFVYTRQAGGNLIDKGLSMKDDVIVLSYKRDATDAPVIGLLMSKNSVYAEAYSFGANDKTALMLANGAGGLHHATLGFRLYNAITFQAAFTMWSFNQTHFIKMEGSKLTVAGYQPEQQFGIYARFG